MKNWFIVKIATLILKAMSLSCRRQHFGASPDQLLTKFHSNNYIAAFWHQNLAAALFAFSSRPHFAMASLSKDGEIAAKIVESFGFKIARGSASRGGKKALLEMIRTLKQESIPGALTVDGPRGPLHEVKHGIIELAKQTGLPIFPVSIVASRSYIFHRSWDQFRLPLPFATLYSLIGEPLMVANDVPKEQFEQIAQELAKRLKAIEEQLLEEISSLP